MIPTVDPQAMLGLVLVLALLLGVLFGSLPRRETSGLRTVSGPLVLAFVAATLLAAEWLLQPSWLSGRTAWRVELGLALVAAYAVGTTLVRAIQGRARAAR